MADEDSTPRWSTSRAGRPRNPENADLPKGVYRRVRNGRERLYDVNGHALNGKRRRSLPGLARMHSLDLIRLASTTEWDPPGIYFLFKAGELIYIGKSRNMRKRVYEHKMTKRDFDAVTYVEAPEAWLARLEAAYIAEFKPPQNQLQPSLHIEDERALKKLKKRALAFAILAEAEQQVGSFGPPTP